MKKLMVDQKKHMRSLPSVAITIIIVAMLIVSGPAQAVQVKLNANDLDNRKVGDTGIFFINVIIGANEKVPLANVSVHGLPDIYGSPGGILVFNVSDFTSVGDHELKGNYNVTLIKRYGWVSSYGPGYGYENNSEVPPYYGYGYEHQFYGYGYNYGYGYGYGEGSADTYTELVYKITVDTNGAIAGKYNVIVNVNTGQGVVFKGSSNFELVSAEDVNPPVISVINPGTAVKGSSAKLTVNITDINPHTYRIYRNNTLFREGMYSNGVPFNVDIDTTQLTTWNYTIWANDTAGNENSRSVLVNVVDKDKIQAIVVIKPETLNLASKGKFKASITLPEGYDVRNIDISTVKCEGATAIKGEVSNKNGGTLNVKFNRQDLEGVPTGDEVTLWVTGKVISNGAMVDFKGSDTIRVIDKGKDDDEDDEDEDDEDEECDCDEDEDDENEENEEECDEDEGEEDEDECDQELKYKNKNKYGEEYVYEYEYEYKYEYEKVSYKSSDNVNKQQVEKEKKDQNKDKKKNKKGSNEKGRKKDK